MKFDPVTSRLAIHSCLTLHIYFIINCLVLYFTVKNVFQFPAFHLVQTHSSEYPIHLAQNHVVFFIIFSSPWISKSSNIHRKMNWVLVLRKVIFPIQDSSLTEWHYTLLIARINLKINLDKVIFQCRQLIGCKLYEVIVKWNCSIYYLNLISINGLEDSIMLNKILYISFSPPDLGTWLCFTLIILRKSEKSKES